MLVDRDLRNEENWQLKNHGIFNVNCAFISNMSYTDLVVVALLAINGFDLI